ncbi:MAG: LysR family transcriptional regulator [Lachnospiraceae bacterium]
MEILQLKYFYALAQTQHVTKTAQQLHIAQPALTQTIHRLEKELGVKLFKSSGRNIVLTEYGLYLQKKIGPVLKALDEIPDELRELSGSRKKLIRLNVLAASNMITETVIEFKKTHEDVNFIFVQNNEEKNADMTIFTREFFQRPKSEEENYYVFTEKIFLAVPKNSEYAKRDQIDLSEMAGKPFISLAGSRGLRTICDRFCMHAGFRPNVVFESDSPSAVQNLIGASQGVGFWPHYSWGKRDESHMALIPISYPVCQRDIVIQLQNNEEDADLVKEYFYFLADYFKKALNCE